MSGMNFSFLRTTLLFFLQHLSVLFITAQDVVYNVENMANEPVVLSDWKITGPFIHSNNVGLYFNELGRFHREEERITYQELEALRVDTIRGVQNIQINSSSHLIDFIELLGLNEKDQNTGNVYAGCILKCDRDTKIMLNFSADDCSKIWLNNKEIHHANVIYNDIRYYENYIELDLKKGENFLLVKVYNHEKAWRMFACLEKWSESGERRHKVDFVVRFDRKYLSRSIIQNDSISMLWTFPAHVSGKLNIRGNGTDTTLNVAAAQQYLGNISNLPDGFYHTSFYSETDTLTQNIYKGDIFYDIEQKLNELKATGLPPSLNNNLEAYTFRYYHLLKPEYLPAKHYMVEKWQRRMLYVYYGINEIYSVYKNYKAVPLNNINSYVSDLDKGTQYYQLFVPDNYSSKDTLPLMIELPVPVKKIGNPLETWRFADIELAELFAGLANKYKIAILGFGGRTIDVMNGNNIDEADLWENINAVKNVINIDTTRMYLRGACQAAFNALKIGTKYPCKWAAVSILSPRLLTELDDIQWNRQNDPLNLLGNMWNTPIFNLHSPLDIHTGIAASEYLNQLAFKEGLTKYKFRDLNFEFKEFYTSEYMDETIAFFLNYSTKDKSNHEIKFSTYELKNNRAGWFSVLSIKKYGEKAYAHCIINNNELRIETENIRSLSIDTESLPFDKNKNLLITHNNIVVFDSIVVSDEIVIGPLHINGKLIKNQKIEGPFAHIFSNRFIVVQGTIGTEADKQSHQRMAKSFNEQWNAFYYSNCRVKYDKDITTDDIKNFHLILLGNDRSNLLIKKYYSSLPLKITGSAVTINGQSIEGDALSFYMIYPNPENPERYIGILGYNNPGAFCLKSETDRIYSYDDISHFGWYDYRIWSPENENIIYQYFNQQWK